jgi:protein-tyrosine kinase
MKQNASEAKMVDSPTLPLIAAQQPGKTPNNGPYPAMPEINRTPSVRPIHISPPSVQRDGKGLSARDSSVARMFQERCRQLCLSIFFQEHSSVRSLGFTSAISGEGKTFLSLVTANVLAADSGVPVTLLECNWEHPSIHEHYKISATPGMAEWLRHECSADDITYQVSPNLRIIPAGNGKRDAVKLLQLMRQQGILNLFAPNNGLLVVDLPPVVTAAYGPLAANLLDAVIVVVHAGVTPNTLVEETCSKLKEAPLQGIILNQLHSSIPRWLRQVL